MDAATRAESRDSIAASAATAAAAGAMLTMTLTSRAGNTGAGSPAGRAPIVSIGSPKMAAIVLTTRIAMSDPGRRGCSRGATSMIAATTATVARVNAASGNSAVAKDSNAATPAFGLSAGTLPSAAGTCCRKMMIAIPSVKPSMTGHGMKVTARPKRNNPPASTMSPASRHTAARMPVPWSAITGPSTTTMAPVGPETCTFEPPKIAATNPATIAVTSPLSAPAPELTPKASASGNATIPTVTPDSTSPRHVRGTLR